MLLLLLTKHNKIIPNVNYISYVTVLLHLLEALQASF
jgi:hypothetical protein